MHGSNWLANENGSGASSAIIELSAMHHVDANTARSQISTCHRLKKKRMPQHW